jgi:hypothetical protein
MFFEILLIEFDILADETVGEACGDANLVD